MSDHREQEPRSWDDQEAAGDRAVADMKQSLSRLKGQVGAYRDHVSDNESPEEGSEA